MDKKTLAFVGMLVGPFVAVGAIWWGAWMTHEHPQWMEFPAIMTAIIIFLGGVLMTAVGAFITLET